MKPILLVLFGIFAAALCGCQKDDSAVYTTSTSSGTETISLHQNGTYTRTVLNFADNDTRHHRKNDAYETVTTQGTWSLVSEQDHLPHGFPIGGVIALHSDFSPVAGSHTMPMIGSRGDRFGHAGQDRLLPAADFQNTFRAIRN